MGQLLTTITMIISGQSFFILETKRKKVPSTEDPPPPPPPLSPVTQPLTASGQRFQRAYQRPVHSLTPAVFYSPATPSRDGQYFGLTCGDNSWGMCRNKRHSVSARQRGSRWRDYCRKRRAGVGGGGGGGVKERGS